MGLVEGEYAESEGTTVLACSCTHCCNI